MKDNNEANLNIFHFNLFLSDGPTDTAAPVPTAGASGGVNDEDDCNGNFIAEMSVLNNKNGTSASTTGSYPRTDRHPSEQKATSSLQVIHSSSAGQRVVSRLAAAVASCDLNGGGNVDPSSLAPSRASSPVADAPPSSSHGMEINVFEITISIPQKILNLT